MVILSFCVVGLLLSLILLYFNAGKFTSAVYLSLFFLGVSLYSFYQYVLLNSKSVTVVSFSLMVIPFFGSLIYLIGPLLYWYVRSVLTDQTAFKKSDVWHLLPMVIFFFAALPALFTPWSDKLEAATAIVDNVKAIEFYKPTLLSQIFSYPFMFLSRPVLISGYTCWSIIIFIRYYIRRKEMKILPGQQFMIRWLIVLLSSLLFLVISHTLLAIDFTFAGSKLHVALSILKAISLTGLMVLLLSPFFFPEVLYGLPRIPESAKTPKSRVFKSSKSHEDKSKTEIRFENDYLVQISDKANLCMKEFQPYLQPDFNMAQLSVLMSIPIHHLAYYFREVKKQTFSDFRNEWRVDHAKKLIREGKSAELTLEAIGILSGFSSRNTFLLAFKKVEGISPHTFLTQIREK